MKHDTTLYRFTDYAQLVLIKIGITERISHFFCCLTIFATRSCMGWGSGVVLVSGTFSSTGNQRPTAQKKMVAQIEKSQYVVFLWFRGWLSIRKTWYFLFPMWRCLCCFFPHKLSSFYLGFVIWEKMI